MRKFILSILILVAMVGTMSAQRVWAYGLDLTQEGDVCAFSFISTNDATEANLVFSDATTDAVLGKVAIDNVIKGENIVELALKDIPYTGVMNWAVELKGEAIEEMYEVTDDAVDAFHFYLSQGVAINNNPAPAFLSATNNS